MLRVTLMLLTLEFFEQKLYLKKIVVNLFQCYIYLIYACMSMVYDNVLCRFMSTMINSFNFMLCRVVLRRPSIVDESF